MPTYRIHYFINIFLAALFIQNSNCDACPLQNLCLPIQLGSSTSNNLAESAHISAFDLDLLTGDLYIAGTTYRINNPNGSSSSSSASNPSNSSSSDSSQSSSDETGLSGESSSSSSGDPPMGPEARRLDGEDPISFPFVTIKKMNSEQSNTFTFGNYFDTTSYVEIKYSFCTAFTFYTVITYPTYFMCSFVKMADSNVASVNNITIYQTGKNVAFIKSIPIGNTMVSSIRIDSKAYIGIFNDETQAWTVYACAKGNSLIVSLTSSSDRFYIGGSYFESRNFMFVNSFKISDLTSLYNYQFQFLT